MREKSRTPRVAWGILKKELHPGCQVRLKALHVQRNGQVGVVEDYVPARQRWRVRLGSGKCHDFKAENLELEAPADRPPPDDWVGPSTGPELQAPQAYKDFKEEEGKTPAVPTISAGCLVVLHGLKTAELNDQKGEAEAFMQDSGRWRVKLASGAVKDLKPENLRVLEAKELQVFSELAALEADLDDFQVSKGDRCGPGNRFVIEEKLGEGTFSTVFSCRDEERKYAVKFTKTNEQTRRALEREVKIMSQLITKVAALDPQGVQCILSLAFFESFVHRGRLCAVFELMKCNLRTALAKYGAGKGLPLLPTVRDFGRQLLWALRALRSANLLHCDVKPENLLLAPDNMSIRLCDFGSCHGPADRIKSDQLMPRNYRAPEIILGLDYSFPIDMWSAAATLFELATSAVLFQGETNNEMLHEMMKVCGPFPLPLVTCGSFCSKHFGANGDFLNAKGNVAIDSLNPRVRPLASFDPPSRPLPFLLEEALKTPPKGVPESRHQGMVAHLAGLLEHCLQADSSTRPTPEAALAHKFFQKGA
ncbi:unnamed protein product [Effrenium voratum]|uniref:Protein kinase domain-containing protein n=1 Tax=Effrenium voratum TaxID=2562239 RepID=A0AA36IWX3_9DINO|nr:unnamed protein product [Effrenium voratum]CAJ1446028.1 unnamed protein product [Effrenium voratum]